MDLECLVVSSLQLPSNGSSNLQKQSWTSSLLVPSSWVWFHCCCRTALHFILWYYLNLILWKLIAKLCKVIQNNVKSCYFQQLTTFGIQTLVGGLQETASQAFLVYTLGPVSRKWNHKTVWQALVSLPNESGI